MFNIYIAYCISYCQSNATNNVTVNEIIGHNSNKEDIIEMVIENILQKKLVDSPGDIQSMFGITIEKYDKYINHNIKGLRYIDAVKDIIDERVYNEREIAYMLHYLYDFYVYPERIIKISDKTKLELIKLFGRKDINMIREELMTGNVDIEERFIYGIEIISIKKMKISDDIYVAYRISYCETSISCKTLGVTKSMEKTREIIIDDIVKASLNSGLGWQQSMGMKIDYDNNGIEEDESYDNVKKYINNESLYNQDEKKFLLDHLKYYYPPITDGYIEPKEEILPEETKLRLVRLFNKRNLNKVRKLIAKREVAIEEWHIYGIKKI